MDEQDAFNHVTCDGSFINKVFKRITQTEADNPLSSHVGPGGSEGFIKRVGEDRGGGPSLNGAADLNIT